MKTVETDDRILRDLISVIVVDVVTVLDVAGDDQTVEGDIPSGKGAWTDQNSEDPQMIEDVNSVSW